MVKFCSSTMSSGTSIPLKSNMFVIIILNIYVSQCHSLDIISELDSASQYKKYSALEHLINLPKNYIIPLIAKNSELNLGGLKNEDIYLNGTELIEKHGHKVEEHYVKTSDGYKLALYRIPGKGPVVFLMHGLVCSFADWITVGPNQALPYLLAAQGYDVWMGNSRGNTYSRQNEHLSPSDPGFWEFSFDEIGSRDLPAMIDYVLAKTKRKKLTYVGHSQGTTAFFVLCSKMPEYNEKIDFMVALSAIAWMKHVPNPILQIAALFHKFAYTLFKSLKLNEIMPGDHTMRAITQKICGDMFSATIICQNLMFFIAGFDFAQINYKELPVIFNHFPSGSSLMQYEHYAQLIESGDFRAFDYGHHMNFKMYGRIKPPSYPVEKITAPIAILYSQGDWLSSTTDVDHLRKKLKNVVNYSEVPLTSFNHVDYLWARDVKRLVYDKVLSLIKQNNLTE